MNCREFTDNISSYIDNEMNEIEKKEFELHILKCNNCRQEYEDMIKMLKYIKYQEQAELPDNYRLELRRKLKKAAKEEKKVSWRLISSIAAGLIIMIVSFSILYDRFPLKGQEENLSKSDKSQILQGNMTFDAKEPMVSIEEKNIEVKAFTDNSVTDPNIAITSVPVKGSDKENFSSMQDFGTMASRSSIGKSRKAIKEAYLSIDLEELDKVQEKISNYIEENGGFIESIDKEGFENSIEHNERSHLIKIRISSDKFEETLDFLRQLGTLIEEKLTHDDITDEYYNIETNLRCLYEQENLLLGILYKVEDADDKALVEDELKKVKEEINSEALSLEEYDNSTMLSTINTKLNEVGKDD
ncbi:putative transmembrane anti-sigma factor [Proteiniborus sp. DW1]|uniref:DUF4349 domain-containing protein n=1 Tax=Proteiniborus sp. DW1 TaxID=1889883 RepID=UPI00092DFF2F|nr:DUF4349 domain-containing protein [Proteiniborus sp. DW1]SCG83123.1 putative transmembrane anti-sigma factor [Proteiniborus sp. DW1]